MDLDIETEHVAMQPEWHRMIEEWVARSAKGHPDLAAVDVRLRHEEHPDGGDRVDAAVRAGHRILEAGAHGACMTTVLHDVLEALERQLAARDRSGAVPRGCAIT